MQNLLTSWWKTTDFNLRLSLKGLPLDVTTNLKKFIKKVNELELPQDIFQEAKRNLAEYIKLLPQGKLVFIVDDLDRCRPDTAVKVLEIVKHFFDIDGLIVVMPINQSRLRQYIDAFYGIGGTAEQKGVVAEDYLQKFFNEIKSACDDMFVHLVKQTGLPRGYIDVVLWKSLQQGLIKL